MKACIIDIDGTLADTRHRKHAFEQRPKDWDTWNSLMPYDPPIVPVIELVNALRDKYFIILCSGRQDSNRIETIKWLEDHGVGYDLLEMRATKDYRDDAVIKEEILLGLVARGYVISFVVDDRKSVVDMWRRNGLVCLQCAEGDF